MAMLAWNVRGLGNKETVRALKNTIFKNKAEIIFLSETKQKKRYMEKIHTKMKIENAFYVEPDGIAGGLALWWSNNVKLSVLRPEEKCGSNPFDHNSAKWYYDFLDQTYLMEIPSSGGSFTWSNQRSNEETTLEKLDRVLSSLE
ncbi:hypothetical protein V6N11_029006 [Hibiscus sabdariffa]|uniref:Endonuclease/exonuclease/phosphatase domain-containing protein n=1 Tax=Hibiscus sabdariffa TaxID=183260 RepID=A0ABR2NWU5_9ROSI